ncbi:phage major capsid protein [Hoeflea sp.]|uniref:phage major capsid protein n=1 Tax=Hoeflea sp. TaxID=1940281 RepID=UPI0019932790|nr:phage major capsid protein [Hoeflea sp.]MBC7282564.1 phage major capsid protein [Hoeflea sp.]
MEPELKETLEGLGGAAEALQKRMDEIEKEAKKFGSVDVVHKDALDKVVADMVELKAHSEAIERKLNTAALPNVGSERDQKAEQDRKEFLSAVRKKSAYEALEAKAVDADYSSNSTSGGVAIPEVIASEILKKVLDISPLRSLVRVTQVSSPNYERLVDVRGLASGWAGESTTRSETGTPTLQRVTFTHGELYAVPKASNWSLNDIMFDVQSWLVESVADEFAYQEGVAITSGNGTNKPTGFLNGAPVSTDDEESPARAFGTLQYIATGTAGAFQNDLLGSPVGDPLACFIDTVAALKTSYRSNSRWTMNRNTFATLLKKRDADGRPLIHWDATGSVPMNILGYPITILDSMPDVGSNTFPVAFGDFRAGYELIDVTGMTMIRDDVTSKGYTLFYVSRRVGGKVVNDDAIKLIKAATS